MDDSTFRPGTTDPALDPKYWKNVIDRCDAAIKSIDEELKHLQEKKKHQEDMKKVAQGKLDELKEKK